MSQKTLKPLIKSDVFDEAKKQKFPDYFFAGRVLLGHAAKIAEFGAVVFCEARLIGNRVLVVHSLPDDPNGSMWGVTDFLTGARVCADKFKNRAWVEAEKRISGADPAIVDALPPINSREFQDAYYFFCEKVMRAGSPLEYQAYLAAAGHIVELEVVRGDVW